MRKLIYTINITIDGYADHTSGIADDELHDFFTDFLSKVDTVLFGRKTYELMVDFWPYAKDDPGSTESVLRFAEKYNGINKIVFSKSLSRVNWSNTNLIKSNTVKEVIKLKQQAGGDISIGGISLATSLMKEKLIDEFWFLVHPVIAGNGRKLFEGINERFDLKFVESSKLNSGVVALHYKR